MKKLILITITFLLSCVISLGQTKEFKVTKPTQTKPRVSQRTDTIERQLEDLEYKLSFALVTKDVKILNTLLADDFTIAGSNITRKSYIALINNPQINFITVEKSEMRIKIYGETAVITGRNNTSRQIENGFSSSVFNLMDVWVKNNDGNWQCVAMSQDSINLYFY